MARPSAEIPDPRGEIPDSFPPGPTSDKRVASLPGPQLLERRIPPDQQVDNGKRNPEAIAHGRRESVDLERRDPGIPPDQQ